MAIAPIRLFKTELEANAYKLGLIDSKKFSEDILFIFIEENGEYSVNLD